MPEGDTVWRAARQLREALEGRVLTVSDFRVPRYATTDLTGRVVTESVSVGKHLLTRVEGGVTVHTHLKMDGSWRIRPASRYRPRDHRVRLILANQEYQAVGFRLGLVEVVATAREDWVVGYLGPDLLGPGWDADEAVRRLAADPGRAAGEALMDQRNLAGVGNVYKAEILFLRGIYPWRPIGEVPDLPGVVDLAQRMLEANKDRVDRVLTGNPARGARTWVYGRSGQPCRYCGTVIRVDEQGPVMEERITYWCPRCQAAAPDGGPAPGMH
jgi:endonuclease-8